MRNGLHYGRRGGQWGPNDWSAGAEKKSVISNQIYALRGTVTEGFVKVLFVCLFVC